VCARISIEPENVTDPSLSRVFLPPSLPLPRPLSLSPPAPPPSPSLSAHACFVIAAYARGRGNRITGRCSHALSVRAGTLDPVLSTCYACIRSYIFELVKWLRLDTGSRV